MAAAGSSGDASQLAGSSGDASQLAGVQSIRIGSFNVGVHQDMLTSKNWRKCLRKVEHIIRTCVQDVGLHIMNLCELGGHLGGLAQAGISEFDMDIFQGSAAPFVDVNSNYLIAWGFGADANQLGVRPAFRTQIIWLRSTVCEPELVVHIFAIGAGVVLIQGNLHIRVPHNARVSTVLRKRIVKEALQALEAEAPTDSAAQPVVLVLVGDCNLFPEQAEEATQTLQPVDAEN